MSKRTKRTGESFLGQGWAFPPSFSRLTGSVDMAYGVEDIEESLKILLNTSLGERIIYLDYGCNLREKLFEPINRTLLTVIRDMITNAILKYEARIVVDEINIDSSQRLNGLIEIEIKYTITATNTRYNFVYPFYLKESTQPFP